MSDFHVLTIDGVLTAFSREAIEQSDGTHRITYWRRQGGKGPDKFSYWEHVFRCDFEARTSSHARSRLRRGVGRFLSTGFDDVSAPSPDVSPFFKMVETFVKAGTIADAFIIDATDAYAALECALLRALLECRDGTD